MRFGKTIVSSDSMTALHNLLFDTCKKIRVSNYMDRPIQIFPQAHTRTSIISFIKTESKCQKLLTTKMIRWDGKGNLANLINNLEFVESLKFRLYGRFPKVGKQIERNILQQIFKHPPIAKITNNDGNPIYRPNRRFNMSIVWLNERGSRFYQELRDRI